jgi:MFS family permease
MLSKIRKKKLEANIGKFYLYRIFSSLIFISPIFVLFYQENGLSMTQVMILQAIYTAIIMLMVIPAGIAADYIGRKKVLIANSILFTAGWAFFALSHSFVGFLIAEITVALSAAMWMASGTAFFYDTLRELDREGSYKRLFGKVVGINSIMWGIAALIGGYIATYSLRLPFWITSITVLFGFLVTLSFTETKEYKHGDKRYFAHLKEASKFAAHHPRIRLFIIYSTIFVSIFFTIFILFQPYLKSIKVPLVYFGWIYFAMNMLAAIGSRFAYKIEEFLGERNILIFLLVIAISCIFGMSRGLLIIGAIFPILLFFTIGVFEPVMSDYINKRTESHHRATVISLQELIMRLFSSVIAPFFGWMVDFWSLETAFTAAVIILMINLFILVGVFTIIKRRER